MEVIGKLGQYSVGVLTKELAVKYQEEIFTMISQIPQVTYTKDEILAEVKGERILYGKWEHSLVVLDKDRLVAVIIGYERATEKNEQYPENTLYISELATAPVYQQQGIGRKLLEIFLQYNRQIGLKYLNGKAHFSVQTNAADWNEYVQKLYTSVGFRLRASKHYDNRIDNVYGLR